MTVVIDGTSGITLPSGSAAVGTTDTQTLTNKTFAGPFSNYTLLNTQTFTSSGTWTKPGSGTLAVVRCWGGGGVCTNGGTSGAGAAGKCIVYVY